MLTDLQLAISISSPFLNTGHTSACLIEPEKEAEKDFRALSLCEFSLAVGVS